MCLPEWIDMSIGKCEKIIWWWGIHKHSIQSELKWDMHICLLIHESCYKPDYVEYVSEHDDNILTMWHPRWCQFQGGDLWCQTIAYSWKYHIVKEWWWELTLYDHVIFDFHQLSWLILHFDLQPMSSAIDRHFSSLSTILALVSCIYYNVSLNLQWLSNSCRLSWTINTHIW